jgi:hypothetical protein
VKMNAPRRIAWPWTMETQPMRDEEGKPAEATEEDRKNREAARRAANPDPGDADDDEED